MHRFWTAVIRPLAEAIAPKTILEIGSDYGSNTKNLIEFCVERDATLHVIDPTPKYDVSKWNARYGDRFILHRALSLEALPNLDPFDLVLIDGDHNWYTVINELRLIEARCKETGHPFPLVMLHDVGWPYGRRDLYYDPETIPEPHRKPHEQKALQPGNEALAEVGLNKHLDNAIRENESESGVLTAIEDFIHESSHELQLITLPGFHGLGILLPAILREENPKLDELLSSLRPSEDLLSLFRDLESSRLDLEITAGETRARLTEAEKILREERQRHDETRVELSRTTRRLNDAGKERATLDGWMLEINSLVPSLFGSRRWRLGHGIGEILRRARRAPKTPTASSRLANIVRQYRGWKSKRDPSFDAASMRPVQEHPEGRPERLVRLVFEVATRRRELKPLLRRASSRGAAVGKRRLEAEVRRLKPRVSRENLAETIRERLGTVPELESWPFVSVIVLNRNGRSYLEKLFAGLRDNTDYPGGFEIILVDNGSTDGSVRLAKSTTYLPVRVIQNRENVSFSEGNNQGARAASGDLLLFMNNDVEPFERGWLKEMVAKIHSDDGIGAVGARLLYPRVTEYGVSSGYAVQHRGIKFRKVNGEEFPRNLGVGDDALDDHLGETYPCPAVQAACLLMKRETFDAVGGFTTGYRYGSEDVDLGLKLCESGREVIASGRAVLFHDESSTQNAEGRTFMRENRTLNRKLFLGRWGPLLHRRIMLDRLGEGNFWTEEPPHAAITLTSHDQKDGYGDWYTAHELGEALEARGWRISYVQRRRGDWYKLPQDLDYLFVLIDQYDLTNVPDNITTVAWIRNWTDRWLSHPWFEDYDIVLASSGISRGLIERNSSQRVSEIVPLASNPKRFSHTDGANSERADYVFTGNFWGEVRGAVGGFRVKPEEKFSIFGKGWQDVPELSRYARGSASYDELPGVYSSAKIVLDDTASPTLPYGAVNSRVFDALATGTLVVTNCEAGVRELFDDDFPTYSSPGELRELLDSLLADDAKRNELADRYHRMVLEQHTYERRAAQLTDILSERARATSFCIKTGIPERKGAESWGDLHFARAIKKQLEERGHPCLIQTLDRWDAPEGLACDVSLHLKGLTPYTPKPGQMNLLWSISHPEKLTPAECDRYDLVFVASRTWAEELRSKTGVPVHVLEQATDPDVFFPEYDPAHARDLVFVGNSRRVHRKILADLLPTEHDLAIWGKDWEGLVDPGYIAGHYLPNRQVHRAYHSAKIVLNDHWDDMKKYGYISNRIYDALASGALVISDEVAGLHETFGDAVVTYDSPESLEQWISYYLTHHTEREKKRGRGREIVLGKHTFGHRMKELLEHIEVHRAGNA